MREIIRASAWTGFVELVEELGGDPVSILAAAHVDPRQLTEKQRYLPLRAYIESQEIASQRLQRPDFGLLYGLRQETTDMLGAIAIAVFNASTPREGIEAAARFLHIHNPAFHLTLSPVPRTTREFLNVVVKLRRPIPCAQNDERILSSMHRTLIRLAGAGYKAPDIRFRHARLSALSVYREMFGATPLFNQDALGIGLPRAMLDVPRKAGNPQLRQVAESYLRSLAAPRTGPFSDRVAVMTRGLLATGQCTPAEAASALGVHERTLQRRLQAEGASFEKIKDDVRREQAETLLAQPDLALSQIALMLDYANPSVLTRSCRRWFGAAPSIVRKRLTQRSRTARAPFSPVETARRIARRSQT